MVAETEELLKDPSRKLVKAPRPGQIAMGRRVAETLDAGGVCFVEAPVGTGKSFAYLVPAILSPHRTVVATAKKSLQDQLLNTDIPAVKRAAGKQFTFTVLKGAGNYFCQARAQTLKSQSAKAKIASWQSALTDIISDGDVATFPGGYPDFWPDVAVEDCDAESCRFFRECGYVKVVKAATEAKIVVTNHHVLAHSLLRRTAVFGDYSSLVIDEGHQFPEALRSAQTKTLSKALLNNLHRRYDAAGGQMANKLLDAAWQAVIGGLDGIDGMFQPEFVAQALPQLRDILATMASDVKAGSSADDSDVLRKKRQAFSYALMQVDAAAASLLESRDNYVQSVTTTDYRTGAREIAAQPLYPGSAVASSLKDVRSIVITSATLSVAGSFNHVGYDSGLPPPSQEGSISTGLRCDSPFNLGTQAVLYAPKHLPAPASGKGDARSKWIHAISQEIKRLIEASDGNTLVLFTSNADLADTHRTLAELGLRHPIIAQKPGRAAEAEQEYRDTDNCVLLGSKSFFEGVNIEGDKLWSVIIPKLPFPVPSDPIIATKTAKVQARYEAGGLPAVAARVQAFNQVCVPPMLLNLMQGAGRLIRTTTDRGVLSILDPRLWTGSGARLPKPHDTTYSGYGETAVRALGFTRRTSEFERVKQYFQSLRK